MLEIIKYKIIQSLIKNHRNFTTLNHLSVFNHCLTTMFSAITLGSSHKDSTKNTYVKNRDLNMSTSE